MKRFALAVVVGLSSLAAHAEEAWTEAAKTEVNGRALTVYSRARAGSEVREVLGKGSFDAPPWVIKNVIDDVGRYSSFMPYTEKSTIESQGDGWMISYQRLAIPLADDRDYVIKLFDESHEDATGKVVWKNRWTTDGAKGGPKPVDGVVRILINEGYWQLEDLDGGKHTKITYYVYTSPGGAMPAFLVNAANTQAVPDLFKAVAKASQDPRYQKTKPTPRTSEKKKAEAAAPSAAAPTAAAPVDAGTP